MWHTAIETLVWLYWVVVVILTLYSLNIVFLAALVWKQTLQAALKPQRAKNNPGTKDNSDPSPWPLVTIQLPMFNEQQVARRLIDNAIRMDYPVDRLHIQVLDDSTDGSDQLVAERVAYWQSRGHWITLLHRVDRSEFKAGALRCGLEQTPGEFIAIFDADFLPPPDWVKRAVRPFFEPGGDRIGMVQTRWAHLNDENNLLTQAQALALDGIFGVQQSALESADLFLNFNGSAGMLRRRCIEEAGNWRGATLVEDLDLSYRAQLLGWKIHYLEEVKAPAEIPPLMVGFKRQQFRWAKGAIQVVRLLGGNILRAPINPLRKFQSIIYLTSYMVYPLMILLLVLALPINLWGQQIMTHLPFRFLGIIGVGVPLFYATSQFMLYGQKGLWKWALRMPLLSILGVGIAVNNAKAVMEAVFGKGSVFERTPKTGSTQLEIVGVKGVKEKFPIEPATWLEIFLFFYALTTMIFFILRENWMGAYFLVLYVVGFGWVAGATVKEILEIG